MTDHRDQQTFSNSNFDPDSSTERESRYAEETDSSSNPQAHPAGERSVTSGGNIEKSTIVTGDHNFVQVIKEYFRHPPTLYEDLRKFVQQHYRILAYTVLLEIAFAALFYQYKDRYLISWNLYLFLAALLAIVTWCWRGVIHNRLSNSPPRSLLFASSVMTIVWTGLFGWQLWTIKYPYPFEPDQFGIAIATFGEGSNFRATERGVEISSLLYKDLTEAIANQPELADHVAVRRIGVIGDDSEQAQKDGEGIGADLVIWGRLVAQGKSLYAYFKVLQAPNLVDNPAFPQTIPITYRELESTIKLPYDPSNLSINLEMRIAQQSLGITAFSLGLAHFHDRDFRLAAEQFENALAQLQADPADCAKAEDQTKKNLGLIFFYLGRSYQLLGDYKASQDMLDKAALCSPNDLAVLLGQSYNYRVMGEEELHKQTLERIIELSHRQPSWAQNQAAYDRALAYEMLKDYRAALREYKAIIDRAPTFFIAYLGAAKMLRHFKQFDEAEVLYTEAKLLVEGDQIRQVWLAFAKGQLYEDRGDTKTAIQFYQQAIDLDEGHTVPSVYYYLAKLYAKTGAKHEAIHNYEELIEVSDVAYWAHGAFATFLYNIGDYQRSIDEFLAALRFPIYNDSLLRAQLGLAYAAVDEQSFPDKESLALAEFEKATQNPGDGEAYIRSEYGRVLYQFGHVDEAITQYELSLAVDKGIAVVTRRNLGQLYELVGNTAQAIEMYQSLIDLCEQVPLEHIEILQFAQEHLHALGAEIRECSALPVG